MATDALIGTFARTDDPSLMQNVCFLYHLLGGGTGDWDVPIGGMGAVSGALAAAAAGHGAEIITGAEVFAIDSGRRGALPPRRHGASRARRVRVGQCDAGRAGRTAGRTRAGTGAGSAGEGQPDAAPAAAAARRNRHAGAGIRRHVPHQRNVQPARHGVHPRRPRRGARPAAVRDLLPFADGPDHPVRGASRLGRADA